MDVKKPEEKKEEPKAVQSVTLDAKSLQEALAAALKQGIAEGMAMAAIAAKPVSATPQTVAQCGECKQKVNACKGKHRETVVFPFNAKWGRWFQGVYINGIRYLSNGPHEKVTVPHDSDVEYMIAMWEANEEEMKTGRERQHFTGSIGPGGSQTNPNLPHFR